jgi:sugar phosphate isomerase/epimerase
MQILPRGLHLTYCSNIHPGESWAETHANIRDEVTKVKAELSPLDDFGIGLRLSARAADELAGSPGAVEALAAELGELGLYVFTLNGFPHGVFHAAKIKERVYQPDWTQPERLRYTRVLIDLLARLLPDGVQGSISTVPGGFRPDTKGPEARAQITEQLVTCASELWQRKQAGGPSIVLALEPEPCCMLETTSEAVEFFTESLFVSAACRRMAKLTGLGLEEAEAALRDHLGLCLDACHAAVEFENPRDTALLLQHAGVRVAKMQVTTGLRVPQVDPSLVHALESFADDVYLHQVVKKRGGGLHRFLDLPQAILAHEPGQAGLEEWRIHYHVPVFLEAFPPFCNTAPFLRELLAEVVSRGLCEHFEVETYTWSVLPQAHREVGLTEAIVRELRWVLDELEPPAPSKRERASQ